MVADDLVELDQLRAARFQPRGEALVQIGAGRLRQRLVSRVPNEEVAEAVAVLAGQLRVLGADEVLAHQSDEPAVHRRLVLDERCNAAPVEDLSLDRAAFEHVALRRIELVEACGQQGLDRRRNLDLLAVRGSADEGEHLLEVQRVAAGRPADSRLQAVLESRAFEQSGDQLIRFVL